jgi:hypothetical protein
VAGRHGPWGGGAGNQRLERGNQSRGGRTEGGIAVTTRPPRCLASRASACASGWTQRGRPSRRRHGPAHPDRGPVAEGVWRAWACTGNRCLFSDNERKVWGRSRKLPMPTFLVTHVMLVLVLRKCARATVWRVADSKGARVGMILLAPSKGGQAPRASPGHTQELGSAHGCLVCRYCQASGCDPAG